MTNIKNKKIKEKRSNPRPNCDQFSTFNNSFQPLSMLALEEKFFDIIFKKVRLSLLVNFEMQVLVFTLRVMRGVKTILTGKLGTVFNSCLCWKINSEN